MSEQLPFGVTRTGEHAYSLTTTRSVCASTGNLHGGVAAAVAGAVAADALPRAVRVVSASYHRPCPDGSTVGLSVDPVREGGRWAASTVVGTVDGRVAFDARVLLGAPPAPSLSPLTIPDVPPPESCPPRQMKPTHAGTFPGSVDWRTAAVGPGMRAAWWARLPGVAARHARIACSDILARGAEQVAPEAGAGISLDHTYRVVSTEPDDDGWCLYVVDVQAVTGDAVHGQITVWSGTGQLLGIATQSCVASPSPDRS